MVVFFAAVVVVVDDRPELFEPDFDFALAVVALVDVGGGSGAGGAVTDVGGGVAAAAAVGSTRAPAVAPGRGSVLAGDAWAGDDGAPADGLAGASSVGGDGGGTAVSGVAGSATSPSGAAGTDRAAWRALRTSGCDRGDTRLVEKRDETSCTPKSPRSTPLAVPRAHVTTRTRRILTDGGGLRPMRA